MRLLVTRPHPDAERTAAALRARGHFALIAPMLDTLFLPPPATLAPPAAILFTSANAVRAVAAWPVELVPRDILALTVGDRTAEAAVEAGFTSVTSASGDSSALAELAEADLDPARGPLLYPTIAAPAGDLAARLAASGFAIAKVEAYRMVAARALPPDAVSALAAGTIDGVLLYSRRTSETFLALTKAQRPHLAAMLFYCLSADVAAPLGDRPVRIPDRPSEAALLALLGEGTEAAGIR